MLLIDIGKTARACPLFRSMRKGTRVKQVDNRTKRLRGDLDIWFRQTKRKHDLKQVETNQLAPNFLDPDYISVS